MKNKKQEIVDKYLDLTKKLAKFPSWTDCRKFGISNKAIEYHYGNLSKLREYLKETNPGLEDLLVPVKLSVSDVDKFRIDLENKAAKNNNKNLVQSVNTLDYIAQFAENVFSGKIKPVRFPKSKTKTSRILNLTLSDLHFGADVSKEETGVLDYQATQEARRLAHIVKETIDYKIEHRDETTLVVNILGDIIQGNLHDPRDAAPLAEQICRAVHLLIQAITQLSMKFKEVKVECQSGNHGRNKARHDQRAVNQKWDSNETVIYYAVAKACSALKNVKFNIPKTPYHFYSVFGQRILVTHGDTVLKPGYPGKAINIGNLSNQLNTMNSSLTDREEIKVAVVGHVHTCSTTYLANGGVMVTNGALIPVDEYAVNLGMLESNAGQLLFESVPGFAMGDSRFIRVGKEQDNNKELDLIIKPWVGFNT